jgi:hypothetical protein
MGWARLSAAANADQGRGHVGGSLGIRQDLFGYYRRSGIACAGSSARDLAGQGGSCATHDLAQARNIRQPR